MNRKTCICFIWVLSAPRILACELIAPVVIPPSTLDGDFHYIYPDYQKELENSVRTEKDVAVVKVLNDSLSESKFGQQVAVATLELLHGWGYQSSRYMPYKREESTCGKPQKIISSKWHVAIFRYTDVYALIPYDAVEKQIKSRGKPDYVYSAIGLIRRQRGDHTH
ncbi:hypothetical protein [Gilvimarinus xylanilyticus]|uniref:Uncharacterized protein n=1 Tax=Gilvimarinus xylanilyticus TaxID=2944139 RepID=A0A9X2HVB1_9GAMM|nr:hypothetical protein [Gilvimarinus xylanilyticus]MCP8898309.1 hypothetical protein [Gilvimarinus xylanilyticus]